MSYPIAEANSTFYNEHNIPSEYRQYEHLEQYISPANKVENIPKSGHVPGSGYIDRAYRQGVYHFNPEPVVEDNMANVLANRRVKVTANKKRRGRKAIPRSVRNTNRAGFNSSQITAPAAGGVILRRGNYPRLQSSADGFSTILCNTEPLNNVVTTALGAFNVSRTQIAPFALTWLTGIATSYSKFKWLRVRLIYIPIVPTSTTGQIVLRLGYDANDTGATSITQSQTAFRSTTQPSWGGYEGSYLLNADDFPVPTAGSVYMDLDVTRLETPFYPIVTTATFNAAAAGIQNSYSPAYLDVATQGGPAAATQIGTVFAKYEIALIEPTPAATNVQFVICGKGYHIKSTTILKYQKYFMSLWFTPWTNHFRVAFAPICDWMGLGS